MRLYFLFVAASLWIAPVFVNGQSSKTYEYTIDLTKVVDDRVYVELIPPKLKEEEVTFYLPKIIPGTYAIADYGRFVHGIKAEDKKGRTLPIEQTETNTWKIRDARKLAKISYWIDDSFDTPVEGPEIFWPAGTNIEEGRNYIINSSGFIGYFDGLKDLAFKVNVIRPKEFYGSTGLIPEKMGIPVTELKTERSLNGQGKAVDVFQTSDYDELIDSPLMYSEPDTAIIKVANAEVLVGCYSPNNRITAREIAGSIREVLMAQKEYLGGKLPVNKYAFIFYFTDQPVLSYGALEHSYSSMYFMPEMTIDEINQQLRDFAAHEFFHILTPLTVHSEEIGNFDFNNPDMSKHLWMYEGVTEYFAGNVQVQYNLIDPKEYLLTLEEKMLIADQFRNDIPFTEISEFTLDKYHDQYDNVYLKGALIALCLDLKLLKLSRGAYGLQDLMLDLSKKYGKDKAFKDDELFDIITGMTFPEIGDFFKRYVSGTEPLPLQEVFESVGVTYVEERTYQDYSLGISNENLGITQVDNKPMLQITSTENLNPVGRALGFQEGDILIAINGETIPDIGPELGGFFEKQMMSLHEGKILSYTVLRQDEQGEMKTVELSAPTIKVDLVQRHVLAFDPEATEEQLALRKAWLNP